jgi:dolichol kinase
MSEHDDERRARQRSRSIVMAIALVAFAILMFAITIARMGLKS